MNKGAERTGTGAPEGPQALVVNSGVSVMRYGACGHALGTESTILKMPLALLLAAACAASEAPATSPVQALPNERAVPAPAGVAEPPAVGRVIAIGDLHGDREAALAVFRMAGVIDAEGHWAAGAATLVQTGDTTDRGPDSKGVIDLLRQLQPEAAAAGGRVVALLGNHETMNLLGDWRYVSPEDLAGFGGSEARKAALGPDGDYGRWLRERGIVAKVGDAVFVHGGVTPSFASAGVDGINARAKRALAAGDRTDPVFGSDGPLWYRGYVKEPPAAACPRLEQ